MKKQNTQGGPVLSLTLLVLITLAAAYLPLEGSENEMKEELLRKIIQRATENEKEMANYGYDVNMKVHWLKRNGVTKKTELRNYRTMWIEEKPRLELHRINDRPLTYKQKKEEDQNKKEWQKSLRNGKKEVSSPRIPFSWTELFQKYDFTMASNDNSEAYVLSFRHRKAKLPARNRIEKVLNHLDGKIWVDQEFRIVRLQGSLSDGVCFGFGLAKVTKLDLDYTQTPHNNLIVPVSLRLNLRVKALFIYSEGREITSTFANYHFNPALQPTVSPIALDASASK